MKTDFANFIDPNEMEVIFESLMNYADYSGRTFDFKISNQQAQSVEKKFTTFSNDHSVDETTIEVEGRKYQSPLLSC